MLYRPAVVVALMRDRGDDARLAVGPGDPADPGLFAQARASAVGGHQQAAGRISPPASFTSVRAAAIAKAVDPLAVACRRRPRGRPRRSAPVSRPRDHVGEGLAVADLAVEGQEDRPHRVVQRGCR